MRSKLTNIEHLNKYLKEHITFRMKYSVYTDTVNFLLNILLKCSWNGLEFV